MRTLPKLHLKTPENCGFRHRDLHKGRIFTFHHEDEDGDSVVDTGDNDDSDDDYNATLEVGPYGHTRPKTANDITIIKIGIDKL